jgi:signal transduction histidine kinase
MPHRRASLRPLEELEAQLETLQGKERLRALIELAHRLRKADLARAVGFAQEALALAREVGSRKGEAFALDALGICHLERGQCEDALRLQLDALRIAETREDRMLLAQLHGNIGLTHHVWRNFDRALEHHCRALRILEETGDVPGQAEARNGIGLVHVARGEMDAALDEFRRALDLARESNDQIAMVGALNNVGNILANTGRHAEAIEYFRQSIQLKQALGDRKGLAGSLINLGMAQGRLGDLEVARRTVEEGLAIAEEMEAKDFTAAGLDGLCELCEQMGDLEAAVHASRRLVQLTREIFDEEQGRRIAEMQARYDTERAAREAELNRLRTQELSSQLHQAQKMGVVGRLAGGVAHDFNNLLTAIGGYSDLMLLSLGESHPLRRNVDEIRRATERAQSLTQQLLAFSRKQILHPQVLDLSRVVKELRRMLERLLSKDIELLVDAEAGLDPIFADAGQIEQVILNLAVNARDAMPRGGTVSITTRNVDADALPEGVQGSLARGPCVRLSVADDGCGMDAETVEHIFEPFFTTKSRDKGTGLGLATVHGIVSQSGGGISVESEPGKGSVFSIFLPRTDHSPAEAGPSGVLPQQVRGVETVLVVEDDLAVRNLAGEILRMHGYVVITAATADEALREARSHPGPIHLLLTDVVLPGMQGNALALKIQAERPETRRRIRS